MKISRWYAVTMPKCNPSPQLKVPMDEILLNFYRYWEHEIGKSK
jgi:hypothetical protein